MKLRGDLGAKRGKYQPASKSSFNMREKDGREAAQIEAVVSSLNTEITRPRVLHRKNESSNSLIR